MPLSTVTITGSWVTPTNTPATGTVTITPLAEAVGGGYMVAAAPVVATLSGGSISQSVVNNSQLPTLAYQIVEQIAGAPPMIYGVVPTGSTLDLSTAGRITLGSVAVNKNWPLVTVNADFTQGPPNLPGASTKSLNNPANRNAVRKIDIGRGRQFELDQAQAGTCTLDITDPLEMLHPSNTSSPFNSNGNTITSYRCAQVGAWWNAATGGYSGNMLNSANAAPGQPALSGFLAGTTYGYDPSFESWALSQGPGGSATFTVDNTTHPDSTYTVWKVNVTSAADAYYWNLRVQASVTYTVQMDVWAPTGTNVRVGWNGTNPVSTTVTGNGAWQTTSVVFTPAGPSDKGGLYVSVPSGTYPTTFWVSNIRLSGLVPGWAKTGGATMVCTPAQAYDGTYSLGVTVNSTSDLIALNVPTAPGLTYTLSCYLYASGAGTVAFLATSGQTVSTTVVNGWQRVSVTFVAADAVTYVTWSATGSSYPATFYLDALQLEVGVTASTFLATGPTFYPLYTGYIERFPLQWDMGGTRGIRPLTMVDALSVLARTEITQAYSTTILADNPNLYMPLNDQAVPQKIQLPQGGQPYLGYTSLPSVGGGSVNFQGDTFLDGSSAVSITQQNSNPTGYDGSRYTYLGTLMGSLTMNPQAFTLEMWVKAVSGTIYIGAASGTDQGAAGPAHYIGIYTSAGKLIFTFTDPNGGSSINWGWPGISGYPDGNWHFMVLRCTGSSQVQLSVDGTIGGHGNFGFTPSQAIQLNNFFVDCTTAFGDPATVVSVANVASYPYALSDAQVLAHYNRGAGYVNEVSGSRVSRLLTTWWGGPMNVAPGKRQMAPDNASGGNDYNTRFVLDVLQEIQETERGLLYVDRTGTVVFEDSTSRYTNNPTSRWTLGENPAGTTEYPYSALSQDFDPTYTFSQTNLTRPGNANFAPVVNATAASNYGQRILTQEVMVNTDFDLTQASTFYLARYSSPKVRVETLTLNPAANPAMWPMVLSLEIGQRIAVKRRTSAGLTTTQDYYIEQINHKIDGTASTWTVDLQCSPVFNNSAWILGDATYGVLGTSTVPVY